MTTLTLKSFGSLDEMCIKPKVPTLETMKLRKLKRLGRYSRPDGDPVNVHAGLRNDGSNDSAWVKFYIFQGDRQIIDDYDFYNNWKRIGNCDD